MVKREPRWKAIDWLSLGIASGVLLLTFVLKLGESVDQGTTLAAVLSFLGLLS
ncbi:MAG: hypothetical protein MUF84_14090 [Anaerolineae bacterium]|nr:hypothetical protein [Anaerolineae bacterium]